MAKDDYGFMLRSSLSLRVIPNYRSRLEELTCGEDARPSDRRQAVDKLWLMREEDKSDGQREASGCTAHIWE